ETALGGLLESLGFARAGRHRSKEVSLYQQGDINLVLNAEPDSFARTHFSEHGPSICAMSLTTDDSIRALNRATALNCPRFDSRVGPPKLKIPAIRRPNESLVYFAPAELGSAVFNKSISNLPPRRVPKASARGLRRSTTSQSGCRSMRSTHGYCFIAP